MISINKLKSFAKEYGFVFPNSDIYGGFANAWDYGPVGALMVQNIKNEWIREFIFKQKNNYLIDSAILSHRKVLETSGHINRFVYYVVSCKKCGKRFKIVDYIKQYIKDSNNTAPEEWSKDELFKFLLKHDIKCEICSNPILSEIKSLNFLFETYQGVDEETKNKIYLRPETAQGVFINFQNIINAINPELPFGIGQIGKSFRNEITPGYFLYKTREFEQMELDFFYSPTKQEKCKWLDYWMNFSYNWFINLRVNKNNLRITHYNKRNYSYALKASADIDYKFDHGFDDILAITEREDYDLIRHEKQIKKKFYCISGDAKIKPHCIESSLGVGRAFMTFLVDAYNEEIINGKKRIFLKLHHRISPIKVGIIPIDESYLDVAKKIFFQLSNILSVKILKKGSVGKRYRKMDAIGTPLCITIDKLIKDDIILLRDRDSMSQKQICINELLDYMIKYFITD